MSRQYDSHGRDQFNIETLKGDLQVDNRVYAQQNIEVLLKGTIAPKHSPEKWVRREQCQAELMRRLEAQFLLEMVGQGGFGKTDLAAWLFAQKKGAFERSLWVDAAKVESFNQFARWVLQELKYLVDQRWDDEALIHELARRLTQHHCFLVVDQVEQLTESAIASFDLFVQYWQERGERSFLLVTTRRRIVTDDRSRLELSGLTASEGKEFLERQFAITEGIENGLQRLVQIAEGHPYLLKMAASWLEQEAQGCLREKDLAFFQQLFQNYRGDLEAQVGEIFAALFAKLPERLRSLLLGVVVYRDAFGLEAAQAMLSDASIEDLRALTEQAFLLEGSEQWTLHSLMKNLVEQELKESDRCRESHERAIAYFTSKIKPSAASIDDCTEELEIFYHRCELGEYALADQVMATCVNFLYRRGYYSKLLPIYEQLTQAWTLENPNDADEQRNLGWAWIQLGNLYRSIGQYQSAIEAHVQAQIQFKQINFTQGKAASLGNLGNAYHSLGQYDRAINFHQQSLEIKREIGDRNGEARSLNNLGNAYDSLGQYDRAINFHQQSLEIAREIGDRNGEARSLGNLGSAYRSLGQYDRAINFHQQSLEIKREIGDRNGEANSLGGLGNAYVSLGQYDRAINFHQQSLEIAREIGDRNGEATSYFNLGTTLAKLKRKKESIGAYQNAHRLYQEMGLAQDVEDCDKALRPPRRRINWILWFCVGIAIVLLIAWLRR